MEFSREAHWPFGVYFAVIPGVRMDMIRYLPEREKKSNPGSVFLDQASLMG
jgi:hypothetical protein